MTLALPTTTRVALAWLALVPYIGAAAGTELPPPDAAMRSKGFLEVGPVGGSRALDNAMRSPIVAVSVWFPPAQEGSTIAPWNAGEQLANLLLAATDDPALAGRRVTPTPAGSYRDALVHVVNALSEPRLVSGDPNHYARYDLDLEVNWNGV